MKIKISIQELYDKGLLDKFCEVMNIPQEAALASCDEYELTEKQAKELGLI
jgi:hypothetical protein